MLWDRQGGESYPAFEAFQTFLTHRNYSEVAALLNKSPTLIKRWARTNSWRARADAWDEQLSRQALEQAAQEFAAMVTRQINIGRMLQSRAANAIQNMDLSNLPPKFMPALIEAIKVGANLERTARELKQTKPQENLFVETLTQIWEGRRDGE